MTKNVMAPNSLILQRKRNNPNLVNSPNFNIDLNFKFFNEINNNRRWIIQGEGSNKNGFRQYTDLAPVLIS